MVIHRVNRQLGAGEAFITTVLATADSFTFLIPTLEALIAVARHTRVATLVHRIAKIGDRIESVL